MLDHRKKGKCRALKADFYFGGMFLCSIKMINGWQNNTEVKLTGIRHWDVCKSHDGM